MNEYKKENYQYQKKSPERTNNTKETTTVKEKPVIKETTGIKETTTTAWCYNCDKDMTNSPCKQCGRKLTVTKK